MNVWSFSFLVLVYFSFCTSNASLEIVAGWEHNCVYEPGQTGMMCWGNNVHGQLGYEDTNNRGDNAGEMNANLSIVNLGPDFVVNATSLGNGHSCAASQEHAVKCWGWGNYYQTGHATSNTLGDVTGEMGANLAYVEFRVDFVPLKVAAGHLQSCVLSTEALVVCFGWNWYGQCGAGTSDANIIGPPSNIANVDLGSNFTPIDIAAFSYHVCALSQQQSIKCFGQNVYGQLGYGDSTNRGLTPQSMGDGLSVLTLGSNFIPKAVATGGTHTCALSTLKTVKCFGYNLYGQCGQVTPGGTNNNIGDAANEMDDYLPVIVFPAGFVPMQMALGFYHTCILSESGQVACFGYSSDGQLGLGHTLSTTSPTLVDLGIGFIPRKITAGRDHTCAVSTVDTVKCWGENGSGQLGLGHANNMGDEANEMGDDLQVVDVCLGVCTAAATTAAPSTAAPSTAAPVTTSLTTGAPTTEAPTSTAPTTAAPTAASPTTASPTTATSTTASSTTTSPTASPTSSAPTTTSQATSDGNEVERSLDGVDSLYQLSLASFLAFCLLLWCCAAIDGYFIRKNDYLRLVNILSCALQASDMLSDCFFVVHVSVYAQKNEADLFASLLFSASIFFIVCPVSSTLYQLYRQIKQKWAANRDAAEWLKQHSKKLYLLSIVSGGAFSAVRLMNSGIFQWSTFSMGLSRREFKLFNTKRVWSVVVLENLPQLAIQGSFLRMSDSLSAIAISSIVFSLVSMLVTVLGLATDRDLFAHDKVTLVSVKVTGESVADKHARRRCRTLKRHLRNDLSMMLEIHRKSLEVMKPAGITDGVLLRFYVYDNKRAGTADAATVNARQVIANAVSSGRFSDIVQQAWELSDAPVISDVKYQMFEDQSVATQQQIELAEHVDSNQRVRDVELEVVEHTQAYEA